MDTNNNNNLDSNNEIVNNNNAPVSNNNLVLENNVQQSMESTTSANDPIDVQTNQNSNTSSSNNAKVDNQQQTSVGNLSQYYQAPTKGQSFNDTAIKRDNRKYLIFVVIFIAIGCYYIFRNSPKNVKCIDDFKSDMTVALNDRLILKKDDIQYFSVFSIDANFIKKATELDDVKLKVCYRDLDVSEEGSEMAAMEIDSIELYNRDNNQKINSNSINELLKELGYHEFGKYTEEATLIDFDNSPKYELFSNGNILSYSIVLKLENGKEVNAIYELYSDQENKINLLKKGKKYKFVFEVKEKVGNPIMYVVSDFE